jgi:hypothetical protein
LLDQRGPDTSRKFENKAIQWLQEAGFLLVGLGKVNGDEVLEAAKTRDCWAIHPLAWLAGKKKAGPNE